MYRLVDEELPSTLFESCLHDGISWVERVLSNIRRFGRKACMCIYGVGTCLGSIAGFLPFGSDAFYLLTNYWCLLYGGFEMCHLTVALVGERLSLALFKKRLCSTLSWGIYPSFIPW